MTPLLCNGILVVVLSLALVVSLVWLIKVSKEA